MASVPELAQGIVCDAQGHRLLIVGDYHGSNEIPDFVALLANAAAVRRPVRLGLEIEAFEQKAIETYVDSAGTSADKTALLHDNFWTVGQGRTSQAIVRLIDALRLLMQQGRDVAVFTMAPEYPGDDVVEKAGGGDVYWSRGIAGAIQHQLDSTKAGTLVIAFMGNEHAKFLKAGYGSKASVSERLAKEDPYIVNFKVYGEAWNCNESGCGRHAVGEKNTSLQTTAVISRTEVQDGKIVKLFASMPMLTPSAPAKEKATAN